MGRFGGVACLIGLLWAIAQRLLQVAQAPELRRLVVGNLVALPLRGVAGGEIGFLFLSFLGIPTAEAAGLGEPKLTSRVRP